LRTATVKQPFFFEVGDGELFAFAGLWEGWRDPSGSWTKSCSILTTMRNAVTSQVHDRMPVILSKDAYELWLDPGFTDVAVLSDFLKPYDARDTHSYPVSSRINQVASLQVDKVITVL
jgi:putative SOS response-associated peptidase YedK